MRRLCNAFTLACVVLFLSGVATSLTSCGKKAPPFLPVPVAADKLDVESLTLTDREVKIVMRVPREKFSIKEEESWSLARILRKSAGERDAAFTERSVVRKAEGFRFGERVEILDGALQTGETYVYKVELRKEQSKSWAASRPMVLNSRSMPAVTGLAAEGRGDAVILNWKKPRGIPVGAGFQLFRRAAGAAEGSAISGLISGTDYIDTGVEKGKDYCYTLRTVIRQGPVERDGPMTEEVCHSPRATTPP